MMFHVKTDKTTNKKLSLKYTVPIRTLQNWAKKEFEIENWNGELYRQLKIYDLLEDKALQDIKKTFKEEELKILIASLNGTIPTIDLIRQGFLEMHLQDTLLYESFNVTQFLKEDENAEIYINATISKIKTLKEFDRYVLVKFCIDFWGKFKDSVNLEEYIK